MAQIIRWRTADDLSWLMLPSGNYQKQYQSRLKPFGILRDIADQPSPCQRKDSTYLFALALNTVGVGTQRQ